MSYPQLPEYEPHPDLWHRIEADLDTDERLARAVGDLPLFAPQADLWERIDAELNNEAGRVVVHPATEAKRWPLFRNVQPLWAGMAAAACVVLVGIWLFWRPTNSANERIEYAVETSTNWSGASAETATDADRRAEEFITQQCAEQALVCNRPEVHELRVQLDELKTEAQRLDNERQIFGDDPALVRAQVKLENQRAEVTKELITRLRS
ncbi:hypothetical protein [Spirosoma montaniterrae]|uniref:Uncharacterized protein n=1 Tax=Spirosoma montaniterrae TaxID=1178516 RepID=A0A1P9X1Q3_9BACT|nr:hypothetical protein [Spirosoma montaniterrae]AQG81518.1 hypothetical protein AWR27_20690 [Spirosoma montaniterrae]